MHEVYADGTKMDADEVKDSDNVRFISEKFLLFIFLFAAFTVHYKFLISLLWGMSARGKKKDAQLHQMLPVRQRVTSYDRILANVHHVVDTGERGEMNAQFRKET
jgi:hypothetical protein